MTLGRGQRGPGGRRSFRAGSRDDRRFGSAPKPWEQGAAPWGGVEIEELPAQPVLARGRARPGLAAAGGAAVILAILAAGFGALGGRPGPSPTIRAIANASGTTVAEPSAAAVVPLVTPSEPCAPFAGRLPEVQLAVPSAGGSYPGSVSILEWNQPGPEPTPAIVPPDPRRTPSIVPVGPAPPERIEIRADATTALATTRDDCATAWTIELEDANRAIELEHVANPEGLPEYARQNRFTLVLARYRGQEFDLNATLAFPGVTTRTTWPISLLPFDTPSAQLNRGKRGFEVEPGCNIRLELDSGYTELVNPCFADVPRLPEPAGLTVPGAPLIFKFEQNWFVEDTNVECGLFEDLRFQGDPSGTCEIGWNDDGVSMSIAGPGIEGTWTLAIDACATQYRTDATNRACGTWYATLEVKRSAG